MLPLENDIWRARGGFSPSRDVAYDIKREIDLAFSDLYFFSFLFSLLLLLP
jgi:hypothetical protein